jgi:hypothetical protein
MIELEETIWMPTFQTQLLNEIQAGPDGATIPESKRVYFQQRLRHRVFDFIVGCFMREESNGLNQAKLGRRIGKPPEVINRWLSAPSNLTLDSISDLLLGICAEELKPQSESLLNRSPKSMKISLIEDGPKTNRSSSTIDDIPPHTTAKPKIYSEAA